MKPRNLIILEIEIWPALLWTCRILGIQVHCLGARMPDQEWKKYRCWTALFRPFVSTYTWVGAVNETDADRWRKLGAHTVEVVGLLKWPEPIPQSPLPVIPRLLTVTSCHPSDVARLKPRLSDVIHQGWSVVLVPRHPERSRSIVEILADISCPVRVIEQVEALDVISPGITILSQFGILKEVYTRAARVVIGGSFTPSIGSHNALEPVQFGHRTITGPFPGPYDAVLNDGWLVSFDDRHFPEQLADLPDPDPSRSAEWLREKRRNLAVILTEWVSRW